MTVTVLADMPSYRAAGIAWLSRTTGKVYYWAGGYTSAGSSIDLTNKHADVFDPGSDRAAGTWSTTAEATTLRDSFAWMVDSHDILTVAGGRPPNQIVTSTIATAQAESYTPATDTWSTGATMPLDTYRASEAPSANGAGDQTRGRSVCYSWTYNDGLYVAGGEAQTAIPTSFSSQDSHLMNDVLAYSSGAWSKLAAFSTVDFSNFYTPFYSPYAYTVGEALVDPNGVLYKLFDSFTSSPKDINAKYDPSTNTWSSVAFLPNVGSDIRTNYGGTVSLDGTSIYIAGGLTNPASASSRTDTVFRYDIAANTWTQLASLPVALSNGILVHNRNGFLYLIGGSTAATTRLNTIQRYDIAANTWTMIDDTLSFSRLGMKVVYDGAGYYLLGGESAAGRSNRAEYFLPTQVRRGRSFAQIIG